MFKNEVISDYDFSEQEEWEHKMNELRYNFKNQLRLAEEENNKLIQEETSNKIQLLKQLDELDTKEESAINDLLGA